MKVTAFDGSPRKKGNSTILMNSFTDESIKNGADVKIYKTDSMDIKPCRGCLMCNLIKRCALRGDDWQDVSERILESDVIVFSTPVYFHHTTASMKKIIDRFRSFIHVKITESGLIHTPFAEWNKNFVLITTQGSPAAEESEDLNNLFRFLCRELGSSNELAIINAVRLAVSGQIGFEKDQLYELYEKLGLPEGLADKDYENNIDYLNKAVECAKKAFQRFENG